MKHTESAICKRMRTSALLAAFAAATVTVAAAEATLEIRNTTATNILVGGVTIHRGGRHAFPVAAGTPGSLEGFGDYGPIRAGQRMVRPYPPQPAKAKAPAGPKPAVPGKMGADTAASVSGGEEETNTVSSVALEGEATNSVASAETSGESAEQMPPPPQRPRYVFHQPRDVPPLSVRRYNHYVPVHDGDELNVYPNDRDPGTQETFKLFRLTDSCADCRQDWKAVLPSAATGDVEITPAIRRTFQPATVAVSFHLSDAPEADDFFWRPEGGRKWRRLEERDCLERIGGSYVKFEVPVHVRIDIRAVREGCSDILQGVGPLCYGAEKAVELLSFESDPWPHPDTEEWSDWKPYEIPYNSFRTTWSRLYDTLRDRCNTEMSPDEFFGWLAKADRNAALRSQREEHARRVKNGEDTSAIYVDPGTVVYYPGRILFREIPAPEAPDEAEIPVAGPEGEGSGAPAQPFEPTASAPPEEPGASALAEAADPHEETRSKQQETTP